LSLYIYTIVKCVSNFYTGVDVKPAIALCSMGLTAKSGADRACAGVWWRRGTTKNRTSRPIWAACAISDAVQCEP